MICKPFTAVADCIVGESGIEEVGLAAGRSQREKKRSYKDLLKEEEEIDAEVRKSAKKKAKVRATICVFVLILAVFAHLGHT